VDIHVGELRRKLERDASVPRHLVTVWKAGYRFDP
jgi:DNA-binding response OmpR family regulator